jgi:hypothetical protein
MPDTPKVTNDIRTHEPNLRELTSDLDGLKAFLLSRHDALREVVDEREKLYTERSIASGRAVDAALKAAETLTNAAFAASEKAIQKAESNAEKWRDNANEWRTAMLDRESKFAAKPEVENEFKSIRTEMASLSKSRDEGSGKAEGSHALWGYVLAGLAIAGWLITTLIQLIGKF